MLKDRKFWAAFVVCLSAALLFLTYSASKAKAGTSWTGCGAGVHGALIEGGASAGGPVGLSMTGQSAGVSLFCDYQMQALVAGVFLEGDYVWGDLHKFGIDNTVTVGGRLGVLPTQNALVYALGQWTRILGSGDHLDSWGMGAGIEVKIPKTPASLDFRYTHLWVEKDAFGPGVDVRGDSIRLGVNFKLGPNLVPVLFDDAPESAVKGCDPKLAGSCKSMK
jgi:hypothetical protein